MYMCDGCGDGDGRQCDGGGVVGSVVVVVAPYLQALLSTVTQSGVYY